MESPKTTEGPSAKPRYPSWATPVGALISVGFLIAAVGGPGPVLNLNVAAPLFIVTIASAVVGAACAVVLERWSYARLRAKAAQPKPKSGRATNPAWLIGGAFLAVVILRFIVASSPFAAAVIWGLFGGVGLTASALLQWENRHPPPKVG